MAEPVGAAGWSRWHASRVASLSAPDSWLGLIGLFWLDEGDNLVGSAADAVVSLPEGPACLGVLRWRGGVLHWLPETGAAVTMQTDADGAPTLVTYGALAFFVIERDGRLAVRLRDRGWATKRPFSGIECFPYDPSWRVEADWLPLEPPQMIEVPSVMGDLKPVRIEWQAVFRVGGHEQRLLPMTVSEDKVFFVFRDSTSGRATYGAGRFLDASPAVDGRIVLDFNFACNPPCAFTPFATCPLPPPENWLPFAIEAGERKLAAHT